MTDWVEQYHQRRQEGQDQKGGPGSGHWGHAGRPGQVGGSAPGRMAGRGRVNREYFTKGPGRRIVAELDIRSRENVIYVLTGAKVQPRHISSLGRITTEAPTESGNWDDYPEEKAIGCYKRSKKEIFLKPIEGSFDEIPWSNTTLIHEVGHHVTMESEWRETVEGSRAKLKMRDTYKRLWEIGSELFDPAQVGLRDYSMSSLREFEADTWLIYQYGSKSTRATLAALIGVDSLKELFGG